MRISVSRKADCWGMLAIWDHSEQIPAQLRLEGVKKWERKRDS